jgi:hypothetical protein
VLALTAEVWVLVPILLISGSKTISNLATQASAGTFINSDISEGLVWFGLVFLLPEHFLQVKSYSEAQYTPSTEGVAQ